MRNINTSDAMFCHDLIANGSAVHAVMPPASFIEAGSVGPVGLGAVDPIFTAAAIAAAALWNAYLPLRPGWPQIFNITAAELPGNIVGQIWIPCGDVCNVTVDPTYNAYTNVLIHEFGHGLGLPEGSVSTKYPQLAVGAGNHWEPGTIDPREIMTATLDADPYLSKYTLDAISPHNHLGCYYNYQCHGHIECVDHSPYSPGRCDDTLVFDAFYFWGIFIFVILCIAVVGISIAVFPGNESPKYGPLGTL